MKALELYKFIQDNNIEWHYEDNEGNEDVIIFPFTFNMDEFIKLIKNYQPTTGIECCLMDGYFAIWMDDICAYFDIELKEVFDKEKEP
jgi:hypothetical protein